jgi:hypothetical protein
MSKPTATTAIKPKKKCSFKSPFYLKLQGVCRQIYTLQQEAEKHVEPRLARKNHRSFGLETTPGDIGLMVETLQ